MIGLSTLAKLSRGGLGPDEILEMLSSMGIEMEMEQIEPAARRGSLERLAGALVAPGSKAVMLRGRMKNGDTVTAVLAIAPRTASPLGHAEPKVLPFPALVA